MHTFDKRNHFSSFSDSSSNGLPIKGFSAKTLKIIGVVMMVFDHVHQMFYTHGVPDWFSWVGRPALPLFLFLCAEGVAHTHSKKRYLLRLLIGYECMNVASLVFSLEMSVPGVELINNIFGTLFLSALYMGIVHLLVHGIKEKKASKIIISIVLLIAHIAESIISLQLFINHAGNIPPWAIPFFRVIPNLFTTEAGFPAVFLGVLFYIFRKWRVIQILCITVLSALNFFASDMQWVMVFSAIFMLLYNGKRGNGGKYFFYMFYPVHIYVLYIAAYIAWHLIQ